MDTHTDEVLRACLLVEGHQVIGIKLLRLPGRNDILEAEFRRVTVLLQVVLVLAVAFDVHVAGVPVAVFRRRLRAPVSPYAELRVTEPVGHAISREGLPCPLKWSRGDDWCCFRSC